MPTLLDLPNELVLLICEQMSNGSLASFIRTCNVAQRIGKSVLYRLTPDAKLDVFIWALQNDRDPTMRYLVPDIVQSSTTDNEVGTSALLYACSESRVLAVTGLLDGGVSPNLAMRGSSALMEAVNGRDYKGSAECVRTLLSRGADVHAVDERARTALHFAAEKGNTLTIDLLLQAGADIHRANDRGKTPILVAASKSQYHAVQRLLTNGAEVDDVDHVGRTALIYAAEQSVVSVARLVIQHGADVDHADVLGRTAVSYAAENGSLEMVRLLIEAGCNVTRRDVFGKRPVDYCSIMFSGVKVRDLLAAAEVRKA
ncbi:ankyrin repeat-containing domain protein [Aspergillus falconensis]